VQQFALALPKDYRIKDLHGFHGRDRERIAEQIFANRIRKGIMHGGVPIVFDVTLADGEARCTIEADGAMPPDAELLEVLRSILGLRIDPAPFVKLAKKDPLLAALVKRQPGLRIMQSATIFEALTWAIIGQQINLTFAIALRRTFIQQAGSQHSSGLWCYPEADSVARLDLHELTERKFSRSKAETLLRLAKLVDSGALVLDRNGDLAATSAELLAIKGIGPWTVNYGLLRGYGFADCSLHGDVAIRAALQTLLGEDSKPDMARTEELLKTWSPHRTMAAAHLWASLGHAEVEAPND
jgi:DNA-3-methyladenine glycosylase II